MNKPNNAFRTSLLPATGPCAPHSRLDRHRQLFVPQENSMSKTDPRLSTLVALSSFALCLFGCGGGSGSAPEVGIESHDLIDPTPGADEGFGDSIVVLENGNIVVSDPRDSSGGAQAGAVHLYTPESSTPFATLLGDAPGDQLGSGGLTALGNSNFVVLSPTDDEGAVIDGGSVRLVNGTTGAQIGLALVGDVTEDLEFTSVDAIGNGNFVVASSRDDVGGVINAGSVRLISGTSGEQIGAALIGDVAGDLLGSRGVTVLGNNNFVVSSPEDDEGGVVDAGSVRLLSGLTGSQIGAALVGDVVNDSLGSARAKALGNNNFVVVSNRDDEGGVVNAGSVRLVSGTTGAQIGSALVGDDTDDQLGRGRFVALGNGNFVIASRVDDVGGIADVGSVRLVSGTTGAQIGVALVGDVADDQLGADDLIVLGNDNFVVASRGDDEGGVVDAGSVRLVSGTTGAQIGLALVGDDTQDQFGSSGVTALGNNNYAVSSGNDDVDGVIDAGSVRLVSGTTGAQIGAALVGDVAGDRLGSSDDRAVGSNNYFVTSPVDDEAGVEDAGSVRLLNGTTGVQIGTALVGDVDGDELGGDFSVALPNNDFVVVSPGDDEGGIIDAGSVRFVSGSTGEQIGSTLTGSTPGDVDDTQVVAPSHRAFVIVALRSWDNGSVDSGRVRLIAE